ASVKPLKAVPAKICRPTSKSIGDRAVLDQRFFPTNRRPAGERSVDRSGVVPLLQRFSRQRSGSTRQQRARKLFRWGARRFRPCAAVQPPLCGRLESLFSLWQLYGEHVLALFFAKRLDVLANIFVRKRENRSGEKRRIFCPGFADRQRTDGNAARHLRCG